MSDADFLAGRMHFEAGAQAGGIENHGLIHAGAGGEVVVWGHESARVAGGLLARGGDGGFVETSAGEHLAVLRGPSVTAPAGHAGTWLIDPDDIRIVAGAQSYLGLHSHISPPQLSLNGLLVILTQYLEYLAQ